MCLFSLRLTAVFALTLERSLMQLLWTSYSPPPPPPRIPSPLSPPRTAWNGFFQASPLLSPRRRKQPKREHRRGGESWWLEKEGFIHCLPLQCGGCCCSGATPGRPFPTSVGPPQARRGDNCSSEGEWVSVFFNAKPQAVCFSL